MPRPYTLHELRGLDDPQDAHRFDGNSHAGLLLKRWLESPDAPINRHVDLARALNISPSSVSRWLVGLRRPRPHTLRRLKDITGLEFYGWQAQAPRLPVKSGPRRPDHPTSASLVHLLADYLTPPPAISEALFLPRSEVKRVLGIAATTTDIPPWPAQDATRLRTELVSARTVRRPDIRARTLDVHRETLVRRLEVSPDELVDEMNRQGLTLAALAREEVGPPRCLLCGAPNELNHDPPGGLCDSCTADDAWRHHDKIQVVSQI